MSRKFAQNTQVPIERSRSEIEKILVNHGADQFNSGWGKDKAVIAFRLKDRFIKIEMPLPKLEPQTNSWNQKKHLHYTADSVAKEARRRWRAMVLYIKAKLESVESNIISFEDAFMGHIVLPNRQTVSQYISPQIEEAYRSGEMPLQLPGW